MFTELSVAEQRYQAVLALISQTVKDVAARFGVARKTVHDGLATVEAGRIECVGDEALKPVAAGRGGLRASPGQRRRKPCPAVRRARSHG